MRRAFAAVGVVALATGGGLGGVALGCGGARPAAPSAPAPVTIDIPTAPKGAAPAEVTVTAPSAHVDATGCEMRGRPSGKVEVSYAHGLTDDGRGTLVFVGTARGVSEIQVVLTEDHTTLSSLVFDVLGLHFDAQIGDNGVPAYARAPLDLAGIFEPSPTTPLLWERGEHISIDAENPMARRGGGVVHTPLVKRVACGEIGIEPGMYKGPSLPEGRYLARAKKKDARLPIARSPGAPVGAELPVGAVVHVLSEAGANARVAYWDHGLWYGWTPRAGLVRVKHDVGVGYGSGHGRLAPKSFAGGHVCDEDLPLFVREIGKVAPIARVGHVIKGKRVALSSAEGKGALRALLREQRPSSASKESFEVNEIRELVVERAASLAHCRPE